MNHRQAFQIALHHHHSGQLIEAEAVYRQILAVKPRHAEALQMLGVIADQLGQRQEAVELIGKAIALKPNLPEAHCNLGVALFGMGEIDKAVTAYRRATALRPGYAEAHYNVAHALHVKGELEDAIAAYRRAAALRPDHPDTLGSLANALGEIGQLDEAIAVYRKAIALKPSFHQAHSNLIFALDLRESADLAEQQQERRRWYEQHGRRFAMQVSRHENEPDPERKLRVGYVSADLRRHSAYCAFAPVVCGHDRSGFEVYCYSGVMREDDATARLRQATHAWRSTVGVSDEVLAGQIRSDRIDILVDLSGHSSGNRLLVFARKPAPVQVTAWGHATGTGLKTMDYFFADRVLVPPQERAFFAEEVIDLPCALCYEPPDYLPGISPLPAIHGNPLTYGCLNRLEKITDRVIALWGRILNGSRGARLLVKDKGLNDGGLRQQFMSRLIEVGRIETCRVVLLGSSAHAEHLQIFGQVDVGLDPFPQSGGISTAEALWMGVPVVTLRGGTVPSRISASLLGLVGLQDWIAQTDDEYVQIAIQAGRDLGRVAKLREDLRERIRTSPWGDVQSYTRTVDQAYRQMWRKWCAETTSHPGP